MIELKNIYRVNVPKQLQTCPLKMLKRDVLDFDRSGLQELLHREMRNGHDAGMAVVQRVTRSARFRERARSRQFRPRDHNGGQALFHPVVTRGWQT
jgi:hypothetical protein